MTDTRKRRQPQSWPRSPPRSAIPTWRDYTTLTIKPGPFINNQIAVREYERRRNPSRIGQPLDRTEWGMTPSTVNAYYNPSMNEIVFPAGISSRSCPNADDAVNYGGMGAVISHEMTHGFDDQGAQFDPQGNPHWWSASDLEKFKTGTGLVASRSIRTRCWTAVHVKGRPHLAKTG
jgi:putative endopeptidase